MTDRDSSLKHISATLARRPNKCITLSLANLSNTGNSPRDSDIPIIKLTPGSHVGSPCNFKRVYMRVQRAKGRRGAGCGVGWGGGGGLTQPPSNFSKFFFFFRSLGGRPKLLASGLSKHPVSALPLIMT